MIGNAYPISHTLSIFSDLLLVSIALQREKRELSRNAKKSEMGYSNSRVQSLDFKPGKSITVPAGWWLGSEISCSLVLHFAMFGGLG